MTEAVLCCIQSIKGFFGIAWGVPSNCALQFALLLCCFFLRENYLNWRNCNCTKLFDAVMFVDKWDPLAVFVYSMHTNSKMVFAECTLWWHMTRLGPNLGKAFRVHFCGCNLWTPGETANEFFQVCHGLLWSLRFHAVHVKSNEFSP